MQSSILFPGSRQDGEVLPRISVVVPSFNQGEYLEDCILSIWGQNYPNLEILLLDGGSTDHTGEVIQEHKAKLTWWRSAPDDGQAAAINEGMARASGAILCWLNSDDMFMPGALLHVGRSLRERTHEPQLVYGGSVILDERGADPMAVCMPSAPFDAECLTYLAYLTQPSCFWTRALWSAAGPLNPVLNYVLDWEWFVRASQITSFEQTRRVYSIYRRHPEHKSGQGSVDRRVEVCQVVRDHAPEYWRKLFVDVQARFEPLNARAEWLERWRVPYRRRLLPLLAPGFIPRLHKMQDLMTALGMQM